MTTTFCVLFIVDENFKEEEFKWRLTDAFKKHGIVINIIDNERTPEVGEKAFYEFTTGYDFHLEKWYPGVHHEVMINTVKPAIDWFNEEYNASLKINILA